MNRPTNLATEFFFRLPVRWQLEETIDWQSRKAPKEKNSRQWKMVTVVAIRRHFDKCADSSAGTDDDGDSDEVVMMIVTVREWSWHTRWTPRISKFAAQLHDKYML